jgi:autotransporter-associated beta strand protein
MIPMMQQLESRRLLSAGTLVLNGTIAGNNTYSGATSVIAGTLTVNGGTLLNGGTVNLAANDAAIVAAIRGGMATLVATNGPFADPTIKADQQALHDAAQKLITDNRAGRKTIRADQSAIHDELKTLADDKGADAIDSALQPLKDQLRADEKAKNKELRAAAEELRVAKRAASKIILADLQAWREARRDGADQATIDAAKKKLDDDKAQAAEDLKPIRDKIIALKDKWRPIITADHDAITKKLEDLDPALTPLFDKLDSDAASLKDKLDADQQKVADAAQKLQDDLKAWRDAHQA